MSDLDDAELAARFRVALIPLVRRLRMNVEGDMTPSLMSALATVARHGPIALGDLAQYEAVTPPMATKLANALTERGLVDRCPCQDDKRVVRLRLTGEGRAVLDRAASRRNAWLSRHLESLTDADREALADAITVIERLNRAAEAET